VVVLALLGLFLFGDPNALMGLATEVAQQEKGEVGTPEDATGQFVGSVLGSTEEVWGEIYQQEGKTYEPPVLVLYTQASTTGCGLGMSAMGPFYCPADKQIYVDTTFFDDLEERFGAPGDFARAYVLAHEVGHHIQVLEGDAAEVRSMQENATSDAERNELSVRLELQADCYAGVWGKRSEDSRRWLDPGDLEEGLAAAAAVGDDRIQSRTQGQVVPDSFTHGTSAQRQAWFLRGFESGDPEQCDTLGAERL
jgi:predicted metalloprotease